jgi:arabinose-5-phosphate isomerase
MALALGDALAVCCLQQRHFVPAQFREFHPGGQLGKKLTRVSDVMHAGEELPVIGVGATVGEAVVEMSRGRMGCVAVVDHSGQIVGIYTDGDLRRGFSSALVDRPVVELMTPKPREVQAETVLADVAALFSRSRIPSVFVTENHRPIGIVHVHDLLKIGLI